MYLNAYLGVISRPRDIKLANCCYLLINFTYYVDIHKITVICQYTCRLNIYVYFFAELNIGIFQFDLIAFNYSLR